LIFSVLACLWLLIHSAIFTVLRLALLTSFTQGLFAAIMLFLYARSWLLMLWDGLSFHVASRGFFALCRKSFSQ
jgi:hypothetical protein